jgi:phosphoserine phosphatase
MSYKTIPLVLTLVADNEKLYNHKRKKIQEIFTKYKIESINSKRLTKNVIDYFFESSTSTYHKIKNDIAVINITNGIIFLQKSEARRKKIIVCDMDMTVINLETINLIGTKILKSNKLTELTRMAMNGEISFKKSILQRTKMLKGINKNEVLNLIKYIKITPGVKSVIRTMNKFGYHTMLVSGGYNILAEVIAKQIGFKETICNSLELYNNVITGNLVNKIIDKESKFEILKKNIQKFNLARENSLAVGDGDNDIAMIDYAGLGIAWKAYPKVKKAADLSLNKTFKNILYIQGYTDKEITSKLI